MIQVIGVSTFTDNYVWLISNEVREHVVIVDPGDAEPVIKEIQQRQMTPLAILITHHHHDVIDGVEELLLNFPDLVVYGPAPEPITQQTHAVTNGESVSFKELDLEFTVLEVPGHTANHIAFFGENSLFCGDALSGAGFGKVLDGSMDDIYTSIHRISQLPAETLIYCTHEYTIENLGFAIWADQDNPDIEKRLDTCRELLDSGRATIPFTLEDEFKTNPFLRTHIPELIKRIEEVAGRELQTPGEVFAAMLIWKETEYD